MSDKKVKKVKMYCITYNNNKILNDWFLKSLHESEYPDHYVDIFVIDNHSNIEIQKEYQKLVKILPNSLRPDFSCGHLSRNWNQCIINGFQDLNNPDCDAVIGVQNDTKLKKDWYKKLDMLLSKYRYIQNGAGDQFQVFTPESVKNIGMYDERFCNIVHQEADYFLRAYMLYNQYSSINDYIHGRVLNPTESVIHSTTSGYHRNEPSHMESMKAHKLSHKIFWQKWNRDPMGWKKNIKTQRPHLRSFVYYPYFEKNINQSTLDELNFQIKKEEII